MLIDTRDRPEPEPPPDPIEIDWRLAVWIAVCLVFFVAAASLPPLPGLGMASAGLCSAFKILAVATGGYGHGLREWRQ